MADTLLGAPSEPLSGVSRSMQDVTAEELSALPPSPIRDPAFVNRFPIPIDEYDALKLQARALVEGALADDEAVQSDDETAAFSGNPPEDGDFGDAVGTLAPA